MRAALVLVCLAASASADPDAYDRDGLHVAIQTTGEVALPLHQPAQAPFHADSLRLAGAVVVDQALGCWRLGGVARVTTEPSLALGASLSRDLGGSYRARGELGTFTCSECRGSLDPRAFLRAELDTGYLMASMEVRVTAFDLPSSVRPIGTRAEMYFGVGAHDWRAATVLVIVEAALYAYVETHPTPNDD